MCRLILFILFVTIFFNPLTGQGCIGTPGEVTWSYWGDLYDDVYGEMYADPDYPDRPDAVRKLGFIQSPPNYDEAYGSIIRGFIKIDVTESVVFNVTGDDDVVFFLSSNESADDLVPVAYHNGYTGQEEHDKFPEQTSLPITLVGGSYYYFEAHQIEGGGGDHITVWWKTSFTGTSEWVPVGGNFIYDLGCLPEPCQAQGTFCNDANSLTINDQQDGACHCVGQSTVENVCIGKRGSIKMYRYDDVTGNNISQLLEAPHFPLAPSTSIGLSELALGAQRIRDNFGSYIQGYLTVPVSGQYKFNITGSNQSKFILSTNDQPENLTHEAFNSGSTGTTEYDKYATQSTALISLNANTYYYFELLHKEGGGDEHFSVFWQTPWRDDWHRISSFYCYEYACSLACVPVNTLCDDGDIYTNNDKYNTQCECVGTPCSGADCDDPTAAYTSFAPCDVTDQLDAEEGFFWQSCTTSSAPNITRGNVHWIQYDLGSVHKLFESHIWNYNVNGLTQQGFLSVGVDYSLDGINWMSLGDFNWPQAPGTPDYAGFLGPDFNGVQARYILISSLTDNTTCKGISKVVFYTRECLAAGTPCDDGDDATFADQFDNNCNCVGQTGNPVDCALDALILGDSILTGENYSAISFIESSSRIVQNANVEFMASSSIVLQPGFISESGATLQVQIDDCPPQQIRLNEQASKELKKKFSEIQDIEIDIIEKKGGAYYRVKYKIKEAGWSKLSLKSKSGDAEIVLANYDYINPGVYTKLIASGRIIDSDWEVVLKNKAASSFVSMNTIHPE